MSAAALPAASSPAALPYTSGVRRLPRAPERTRPTSFTSAFDDRTLFYDCFRHADGEYRARREGCERAARQLGVAALRDITPADLDDALARLDDDELRRYVRHVVTEDERVLRTVAALRDGRIDTIGELLTESHRSMRDDYRITTPELDTAVHALLDADALGARMTGGGFGGCAIAGLPADAVDAATAAVERAYTARGFSEPGHFTVSPSPGARRL